MDKVKMLRYHKALDYLHKKEPDAIRAILDTLRHELDKSAAADIKTFHDLPYLMLTSNFFKIVKEDAEGVIVDDNIREQFVRMLAE